MNTNGVVKDLDLSSIRIDGGTQMRAKIDQETVAEYRDVWLSGAEFPPLVVYWDGTDFWLAGGFHRYHGAKAAEREKVRCEVRDGTLRNAILFAVGDNQAHGLKRSNADKRKAVQALISDKEWGKKSDRWIAEAAGVSDPFVGDQRKQVQTISTSNAKQTRTGKDGKEYPAKPKQSGKGKSKTKSPDPEPESLADLAGNDVPDHLLNVAEETWHSEAVHILEELAREVKSRSSTKHGVWLLCKKITDGLAVASEFIGYGEFHCICPKCNGAKKGCADCRKSGWVPKWQLEAMESFT